MSEERKPRLTPEQKQIEESRERRSRRRAEIGQSEAKLAAPARPGFKRRFVNDVPGRIDRFRDSGWEVAEKDGGIDSRFAGKLGGAQTDGNIHGNTVLMEIPEEFYHEDQQAKSDRIVDPTQMIETRPKAGSGDQPSEYIPGGKDSALQREKLR